MSVVAGVAAAASAPGAVITPISQNRFVVASAGGAMQRMDAPDLGPWDAEVTVMDPRTDRPPLTANAVQHSRITATSIAANGTARFIAPFGGTQNAVVSGGGFTFSLDEPTSFALVGHFELVGDNLFAIYSSQLRSSSDVTLARVGDNGTSAVYGTLNPGTYSVFGGASGASNAQYRAININFAWYFAIPAPSGAMAVLPGMILIASRRRRAGSKRGAV